MTKRNVILIIGLLLCGVALADLASSLTKIETYVEVNEITWQQIKNSTPSQWRLHAQVAGLDPNELKAFNSHSNILRTLVIERKRRAILTAQATAMLVHIRKAGSDVDTIPVLREILENWETYGVEPNAFD